MTRRSSALKTAALAIALLFGFALRGRAQSTEGYTDILYDESGDQMLAFAITYPDYDTLYYYVPHVHMMFMKEHDYQPINVWLGDSYGTGGEIFDYALASVTAPVEAGVPYSTFADHSMDIYFYDEWYYGWYDYYGYGLLELPYPWDLPRFEVWVWAAPIITAIQYLQSLNMGQTAKEAFFAPAPTLSCPSPATRGTEVKCTVSGVAEGQVLGWSFSGENQSGNVLGPSGVKEWKGIMVQSGTVSVTLSAGLPPPDSQHITVNNRSWASQIVNAGKVDNGTFVTLPTPPYDATGTLGQSAWQHSRNLPAATRVPGGPNDGFYYFDSQLTLNQSYRYEVNPDVENAQSAFAQKQFGDCGVISRANLENNVVQHESSDQPEVQSHYNQYKASLSNQDHDPNVFVEKRVAQPGSDPGTFRTNTNNAVGSLLSVVNADAGSEGLLHEPNENQATGAFMGNINWPPYPYTWCH